MGRIKEESHDFYAAVHKLGYLDDQGFVDWNRLSAERYWVTNDGAIIKYHDLSDDHLNKIILLFNEGKFGDTAREPAFKGLMQEYLRRTGYVGETLYENSKIQ